MKKLVYDILNKIKQSGISFGDVRFTSTDTQSIYFEKGNLRGFGTDLDSMAVGIRVLTDGCWGFTGTKILDKKNIDEAISRAINNAKVGATFRNSKLSYKPLPAVQGSYFFQPEEDPFMMPDKDKLDYFENISRLLINKEKIVYSYVYGVFYRQYKIYANTEGTFTDSLVYDTVPAMYVLASDGKEAMCRTHPGHMAGRRGGFEVIRGYDFAGNSERVMEEAISLLTAPRIEEEKADIIIGGSHLALQLHESAGHATEADRIFGKEISYAGKTFIKPSMLGNYKYGSDIVNIYSDSTSPLGMGYHLVDDEGTPGKKVDIVKNGILVDQQTCRETAQLLGVAPSSNMLASYADDIPLIRMTNFCLAPGKGSLKEMIAQTENGYYIDYTKTWSIDDNRNNFQFTTEIGWKIKNGELTHVVKEPTYYGITNEFWNACDMICGEEEWFHHGTFHCGKGEPGQSMHLSHGVAPARFRNIVVNVKA
ncbi:MAG: TldD/PmbA family protein [Candidatus Cloacimonetes bacterium]|nr:TldD/PmbA family protein [Candidatus Cloacimonadota bacterium]